jgi:hypothetical protein
LIPSLMAFDRSRKENASGSVVLLGIGRAD